MALSPRFAFKVKKRVKETVIKIDFDTEYLFRIEGEIYKARDASTPRKSPEDEKQSPPNLMSVTLLDDNTRGVIVVPHVLHDELTAAYPDGSYVGRMFQVIKHKIEGKRYNDFEINEIESDGIVEEDEALPGDLAEEDAYEESGGDAVTEALAPKKKRR
jgi:hypothetical protein